MATKQEPNLTLTEYKYDAENRLMEVKKAGSLIATYEYDGDGGRTKKTVTSNGATTIFVGSLFEKTGTFTTKYVFLGGTRVAALTNGKTMYYYSDHLGGTNVITDSVGVRKELIEYDPYGEYSRHDKWGTDDELARFYFTGKRKDDESGLIYFGARYYDPKLGRFITADTMVPYPMNPQAFNRYSYVHNNPVNLTDPTGNFAWFIPAIVAAIKGAVIGATIGAATAAITGGNIGQGALFGAIGGAAFAGFGSLTQSAFRFATVPGGIGPMTSGATFAADLFGGIIGGAAGGAAGAAYLGADPLNGAGLGALSGGLFGQISRISGTGWAGAGRVALAGIAGGGISELAGGSFWDGFAFAGTIASADFIYRAVLQSQGRNRGATMETAKKTGMPKLDANGNPIGGGQEIVLHKDLTVNHVGTASKTTYQNSNIWEKLGNTIGGETGPTMNTLSKNVPGFQGLSYFHDTSQFYFKTTFGKGVSSVLNFPTMPVIYGVNMLGSPINDAPGLIGTYERYRREF